MRWTYKLAGQPKESVVIPGAGHVDLSDRVELIPLDELMEFSRESLTPQGKGRASPGDASEQIPLGFRRPESHDDFGHDRTA